MTNLTKKFWILLNLMLPTLALSQGLMQRNIDGTVTPYHPGGKIIAHDTNQSDATTAAPTPFLIVSDRPFYQSGDMIRLWIMDLGGGVEQGLHITISETFTDGGQTESTSYPCDCGGSNAGFIPRGFVKYQFMELLGKKIPPFKIGKYTFIVNVQQENAGLLGSVLQTATVTVYSTVTLPSGNDEPLFMHAVLLGQNATLLSGKFPVNSPMYYYVGIFPYTGTFVGSPSPSVVSTDGVTLTLPLSMLGGPGRQGEGRIWLMTPDGQFSAVSTSFIY